MFYKFAAYGFLKNLRLFEPFILLFLLGAGISYTGIGLLFAIKEISVFIFEIPTGVLADALGRRKSMLFSMGSYMVSFAIFFLFSNFWVFALAMVLYAVGDALRTGTHKALILEYLKIKGLGDKKVEYYGATRSFSQLGSALNSLLAGTIVFFTGNYRDIFLITIIPYVLNLINLATYPKELDGYIEGRASLGDKMMGTLRDFKAAMRDKIMLKAILNSSLFSASYESVKDYLQAILQTFAVALPILTFLGDDKRTAVVIGVVYFFIYLLTSYASRNAHRVVKRIGELHKAINASLVIGGALIIIAGLTYQFSFLILSILFFLGIYVLHNLRRPMNVGYISDRIKSSVMASGLSVESYIKTMIAASLSVLMGYMADAFGVGVGLFAVGMLVVLVAPAIFLPRAKD